MKKTNPTSLLILATCFLVSFTQLPSCKIIQSIKENPSTEIDQSHFDFPPKADWLNTSKPLTMADLKGKIFVLNFWSYTCINCINAIEELKKLEQKWGNEILIIGVHCGKYHSEKKTENIRQAIIRQKIDFPVINDSDFFLWKIFGLNSWPSFVLVNSDGEIIGKHSGENIFSILDNALIEKFKTVPKRSSQNGRDFLFFKQEKIFTGESFLSFPTKLTFSEKEENLFVSDSGNHQIVQIDTSSEKILEIIGNGEEGFKDGDFDDAEFNFPTGIYSSENFLYVADSKNHSIRKIDLKKKIVTTIAGTGKIENPFNQESQSTNTSLNSPSDLVEYNNQLYVSMRGTSQIWRISLEDFSAEPYAGSGNENLFDGKLSDSSFAEPSGISKSLNSFFIVDSSSSSVRFLDLQKNVVRTLIGKGLFNFGDVDGDFKSARLQAPFGVLFHQNKLYIADSLNHKIKLLDLEKNKVKTLVGTGDAGNRDGETSVAMLNEPSGIAAKKDKIFIADTNNHLIRVFHLNEKKISTLDLTLSPEMILKKKKKSQEKSDQLSTKKISISEKSNFLNLKISLPKTYSWKKNTGLYFEFHSSNPAAVQILSDLKQTLQNPKFPISIPIKTGVGYSDFTITTIVYFQKEDMSKLTFYKNIQIFIKLSIDPKGETNPSIELSL